MEQENKNRDDLNRRFADQSPNQNIDQDHGQPREHIDPAENNDELIPMDDAEDVDDSQITGEDLKYNAEDDTFELDPETEDQDYQHPLPYDTTAPSGEDDNSSYDEENPYTPHEYRDMHSELTGKLQELDTIKDSLDELPDDTLGSDDMLDSGDLDQEDTR